ncbi:MAG: arsenate reductase ArsC [Desulfuromonadales bacterium]|nr:arsenate reductase ArsC [Desulfuromonadales bacterium]
MKKRVLFLCTHNSCRSQMAEGLINHDLGHRYQAFSAGTEATRVNPRAIKVMQEIGIDIATQRSKTLDEFDQERFDYVITLCGDAHERCPLFWHGIERLHIGFHDPSKASGSEAEIMAEFRKVRDEIREKLVEYLGGK